MANGSGKRKEGASNYLAFPKRPVFKSLTHYHLLIFSGNCLSDAVSLTGFKSSILNSQCKKTKSILDLIVLGLNLFDGVNVFGFLFCSMIILLF